MKRIFHLVILLFLLNSCARQTTIGLKSHQLNSSPRSILWFQIPGLTNEHLAMLRFSYADMLKQTAFENMTCFGNMWSFNLYEIRPDFFKSLQSQMSSSKNIKDPCSQMPETNLWRVFKETGIDVSLYEHGADLEQSITQYMACPDSPSQDLNHAFLWVSRKAPSGAEVFHFQDQDPIALPGLKYDQTCQGRACFADFSSNTLAIWNRFRQGRTRSVFIVRDLSYLNFLKAKNIPKAREQLIEIEKTISLFMNDTALSKNTLILVTSAEPINFEFPSPGDEWAKFEKSGKFVLFRHPSLLSPVYAIGPRSENFCGVFDESEVLKRILYSPEEGDFTKTLRKIF